MFEHTRASWAATIARVAPLAGLLGLLILLATLQYRWVGELSSAERERMHAWAEAHAQALARDFDHELTRAFIGLAVDPECVGQRGCPGYAERYEAWRLAAADPGLVAGIYLVAHDPHGSLVGLHFDPRARSFTYGGWDSRLDGVRARLETLDTAFRRQRADPNADRTLGRRPPWMRDAIAPEVPALVVPIIPRPPRGGSDPGERSEFFRRLLSTPPDYVIIALDLDRITRAILPTLTERHFGGTPDYSLTVVSAAREGDTLWRSDPASPSPRSADASAALLSLRFDEPQAADGGRAHTSGPDDRSAPGYAPRAPGLAREAHWRLLVSHRSGSLDSAVAASRARNLAVSLGILLVLGTSVALVVVSAQRARQLAARQMDFVAGVSHELRTPIAVLCSVAENVADGLVEDPARARRYGALLRSEGQSLARLVEQVLEHAGADAGRPQPRGRVSVSELVDEALRTYASILRDTGFVVERDVETGLADVVGDIQALGHAVGNLVGNAVKHAATGRYLRLRAQEVRGEIRISVEDRGRGIPAAEIPHLFEPFYRGSAAQNAQVKGFGLGLSLAQRTAEDHGGAVSVESEVGRGSVFTLHLPCRAEETHAR